MVYFFLEGPHLMVRRITTPTGPTIALLYARVSSSEQEDEGKSLPAQVAACRQYVANQEGWMIGPEFTDVMSGKRADRPQYQAMLSEARRLRSEGKPVAIVVKWLHRLG